ncbi:iron-containing alcohol dehydrogenase [Devosia rhizoryzae]|uniref:Iron-containing alcohol dehydrogenase n=1 Tax=Devosia rhizoryzae TaxID=2774137 RepID=A0ABX7C230_9HYPH|nr:iron-containing alcohol dehydrogenase [Devosia rhizoryzae]QQR38287.1 iron-containing alcohol dehydrogenase [Devosia rhizoryzae]
MSLFAALRLPREVLFGAGQRHALGKVAARLGERALICTDARLANEPVFAEIVAQLEAEGITVEVDSTVEPDVPRDSCSKVADAARGFAPDMVIGIGGGSCLDLAKTVALLLQHGGTPDQYYGEGKVPGPILPMIAVPTTAGTGSEVTPVAVLSDPDRAMKVGISSAHLIPSAAICDPELTLTCPAGLTAIAGADALTHAIEAYTAIRRQPGPALAQERVFVGKSALTDHFALLAIELLGRSLERAYREPGSIDARADVMMGALCAGMAFGTAGTAAAHAIQYPIGTLTHTAHGLGVACMLPYVMTFNRSHATAEFAAIGRALGSSETDEAKRADAAIELVRTLFERIGIPVNLKLLGLQEEKLGWTGEQALTIGRLIDNNPRPLDASAMQRLIGAAFSGILQQAS